MKTNVTVNTYTYSVTYVTQQLLGSLKSIIRRSGLSLDKIMNDWVSVENAVFTWLSSKHLQNVALEIYNPTTDALVVRWDIDVEYGYSSDDNGSLWVDTDAIMHALAKAGAVASICKYEFKMRAPGGANVAGWGPCSYRSTAGFTQHSVGTTIGANSLGSSTSYWRKAS